MDVLRHRPRSFRWVMKTAGKSGGGGGGEGMDVLRHRP